MHTDHQTAEHAEILAPRVIEIELLALDLSSCTRCVGTLDNIERAIDTVRSVLEVTGARVNVRKLVIESEEQARQYRFVTSPTVRIDGKDLAFETLESRCDSCTDLCGCDEGTHCRVWRYQGKEYTEAPAGFIVEALLREIGGSDKAGGDISLYEEVPENLRRFFTSKSAKQQAGTESCCPSTDQETCCAPGEKAVCCGTSAPGACGCR
ncbi:MAG: DUF2703 domain-containing protein [Gemmatimonadales bacterium]